MASQHHIHRVNLASTYLLRKRKMDITTTIQCPITGLRLLVMSARSEALPADLSKAFRSIAALYALSIALVLTPGCDPVAGRRDVGLLMPQCYVPHISPRGSNIDIFPLLELTESRLHPL